MGYTKHAGIKLALKTVLILVSFVLLYCYSDQSAESTETEQIAVQEVFLVTEADRYTGTEDAVELSLDQQAGDCVIDKGGRYLLTGELQGTLSIDAEDQLVHLILNNASITGTDGPAVSVLSAGKVFITSLENTVNSLGDSPVYGPEHTENACIYSTADLTVNGSGELLITGLYEDSIYCRDTLKILCSNLKVQSKRDCLRGNDGVLIQGSNISLEAERNGIRTTNSGLDARGDVEIRGAELSVIAGSYCVNAASDFYVQKSDCFFKGILDAYVAAGEVLVEEECLSYG